MTARVHYILDGVCREVPIGETAAYPASRLHRPKASCIVGTPIARGPRINRAFPADVLQAAADFAAWDDDSQARFFTEVARLMDEYEQPAGREYQIYYIARHMVTCTCATARGRELVKDLAAYVAAIEKGVGRAKG